MMGIAAEDGRGISVASMREIVTGIVPETMAKTCFPAKPRLQLTKTEIKDGLLKLEGIAERNVDEIYETNIQKLLKMDWRKESRMAFLQWDRI